MNSFDVIVVGAGPAGAVAAEKIASVGYSALVLEKQKMPRDKPCAGVLPPRIFHLVRDIPDDVMERRLRGYHVFSPSGIEVKSEFHRPGLIVDRRKFDCFLAERARDTGAIVYDKVEVNDVVVRDAVEVISDRGTFTSKFLVAADGVNSLVKNRLGLSGFKSNELALGVQYVIELCQDKVSERFQDYFEVHYTGVIEQGYGWLSPQKNTVKVGLGSTSQRYKSNPKKFFERFMKHEHVGGRVNDGKVISFSAHHIPLCGPVDKVCWNRVFFVGDAGGFVWPMTGEGVYPGMLSGIVAGEALVKILDEGAEPLDIYGDLLEKRGLLRLRNHVKDREILKDRKSMEDYVRRLKKLKGL